VIDRSPTTALLAAELPDVRFTDDTYLRWLYDENPYGGVIERNVDDDDADDAETRRLAHYALIPQSYRDADGLVRAMFSLNAVTRAGQQRQGHFRRIGLEIYGEAAAAGYEFVVGVSNDKSVGAVVKYMGWRHWGPMPVRICVPTAVVGARVEHHRVDAAFLESPDFDRLTAGLDQPPLRGVTNRWTPEYLRWRLSRPHAAYVVHATNELFAVSTRDRRFGVPAAVLLKILPRVPVDSQQSAARIVSAACGFHRAPYAVYAGINRKVRVRGIRPALRLQPSPLHLIIRHLDPAVDQDLIDLDSFELLDGDAY